jgi:hypothetical protein
MGPEVTDDRLVIVMDELEKNRYRDAQVLMLHARGADTLGAKRKTALSGIYVQGDRTWIALEGMEDQQAGVWSVGLREDGTGWVLQDGNTFGYDNFGDAMSITARQFPALTGRFKTGRPHDDDAERVVRRFVPDRPVDATSRGTVTIDLVVADDVPVQLLVAYDAAPDEVVPLTSGAPDGRMILGSRKRMAPARHAAHAARVGVGAVSSTGKPPALEVERILDTARVLLTQCVARSGSSISVGEVTVHWAHDAAGETTVRLSDDVVGSDVQRCMERGLMKVSVDKPAGPYTIDASYEIKEPAGLKVQAPQLPR